MSIFAKMMGGSKPDPIPEPEPVVEETVEVVEEPVVEVPTAEEDLGEVALESDVSIGELNKDELEAYGRTVGIELDRRHSRRKMARELEDYLADS